MGDCFISERYGPSDFVTEAFSPSESVFSLEGIDLSLIHKTSNGMAIYCNSDYDSIFTGVVGENYLITYELDADTADQLASVLKTLARKVRHAEKLR